VIDGESRSALKSEKSSAIASTFLIFSYGKEAISRQLKDIILTKEGMGKRIDTIGLEGLRTNFIKQETGFMGMT